MRTLISGRVFASVSILYCCLLFDRVCLTSSHFRANQHGPPVDGIDWIGISTMFQEHGGISRWRHSSSIRKAHNSNNILIKSLDTKTNEVDAQYLRLPRDLYPTHYIIEMLPFVEEGNFTTEGYISIDFDCIASTRNVTLHSKGIVIDRSSIKVLVSINSGTIFPLIV